VIASLGTLELGPVPALPEAIEVAKSFGLDLSGHRARSITGGELEPYDLVLGFERMHVAAAVVDGGARLDRTFTLPELVELLEAIPATPLRSDALERMRTRIGRAHDARPPDLRTRALPEIQDPLGRTRPAQRKIAAELHERVVRLAGLLLG
jgi:protein-tyrosine phosphatase